MKTQGGIGLSQPQQPHSAPCMGPVRAWQSSLGALYDIAGITAFTHIPGTPFCVQVCGVHEPHRGLLCGGPPPAAPLPHAGRGVPGPGLVDEDLLHLPVLAPQALQYRGPGAQPPQPEQRGWLACTGALNCSMAGQAAARSCLCLLLGCRESRCVWLGVQELGTKVLQAALALHEKVTATFRKTAINFHYEFTVRHLANVFQVRQRCCCVCSRPRLPACKRGCERRCTLVLACCGSGVAQRCFKTGSVAGAGAAVHHPGADRRGPHEAGTALAARVGAGVRRPPCISTGT